MIPLSTTYRRNSYDFELVDREGDVAIYAQIDPDSKRQVAFEVFEVMKFPEREMFGATVSAREATPSNEQWGSHGFTVWTLDAAKSKQSELQTRITERNKAKEDRVIV